MYQSTSRPEVSGWIYVDLAPFVSESLGMGDDGYKHGYSVIAGAPIRVPIRINLGRLRFLDAGLARQYFSEAGKASKIEVLGEDARAIQALLGVLRGDWDERTAA